MSNHGVPSLRCLVCGLVSIAFLSSPAFAEANAGPGFEVADVHLSPNRVFPILSGGILRGDRYALRQATMVDLIAAAYGVDPKSVQGGPSWLEYDRYDVVAKAPPGTSRAAIRLMLQSLLAERFALHLHTGSNTVPAFVLTAIPGKTALTSSDTTPDASCRDVTPLQSPYETYTCHGVSMETFAETLHEVAKTYLNQPVVDATGLAGNYTFDLYWTDYPQLEAQGGQGISIFQALERQLGLRLKLETTPRKVVIVDSVNERPTPNRPGIEELLPPEPLPQFEVAVIRPSKPDTDFDGRINGDQMNLQGATLDFLIRYAWNLSYHDKEAVANAPKWLDSAQYDVLAKISSETLGSAAHNPLQLDNEEFRELLRNLLAERFHLKTHIEDRTITSYSLVAVSPKLTPADPTARTRCHEGPGPDGKDPRIVHPALDRLITCENVTLGQLSEELQHVATAYIFGPIQDETHIPGAWNLTLSFSSPEELEGDGDANSGASASDPTAAISLFEA